MERAGTDAIPLAQAMNREMAVKELHGQTMACYGIVKARLSVMSINLSKALS